MRWNCFSCARRQARNRELEQRVAELEAARERGADPAPASPPPAPAGPTLPPALTIDWQERALVLEGMLRDREASITR